MKTFTAEKARLRLDELLVRRGLFATRSRARDAILRGTVTIGGVTASKPGQSADENADISVDDPAARYVSRAALKLIAGLDAFGLDPGGRVALDIGASTGGFTQVLLERGAARVVALDVGHGQLAPKLRDDPRVSCIEGINARALDGGHLGGVAPDFLVGDVSFVSLKTVLPPALDLAAPGAPGVFLVKPQFEAGRAAIGRGGLLRDADAGEGIANGLAGWLDGRAGWRALGVTPSPISGGDGNGEFLLGAVKDR